MSPEVKQWLERSVSGSLSQGQLITKSYVVLDDFKVVLSAMGFFLNAGMPLF